MFGVIEREHDKTRLLDSLSKAEGGQCDFGCECPIQRVRDLTPIVVVATEYHVWLDATKDLTREGGVDHILELQALPVDNQLLGLAGITAVGCVKSEERNVGK